MKKLSQAQREGYEFYNRKLMEIIGELYVGDTKIEFAEFAKEFAATTCIMVARPHSDIGNFVECEVLSYLTKEALRIEYQI